LGKRISAGELVEDRNLVVSEVLYVDFGGFSECYETDLLAGIEAGWARVLTMTARQALHWAVGFFWNRWS
jgi:hypothetical protein